MELDELKIQWSALSDPIADKHTLTTQTINDMTTRTYNSQLKKINYAESAGGIICFLTAGYIAFNFYQLNTPYLKTVGAVAILILLVLPLLSWLSLNTLRLASDLSKPHAEVLRSFAKAKLKFQKFLKLNTLLSYLLLITVIVLMAQFFARKDLTNNGYFYTFAFCGGYIYLMFFSRWVNRSYNKSINQAETLLQALNG